MHGYSRYKQSQGHRLLKCSKIIRKWWVLSTTIIFNIIYLIVSLYNLTFNNGSQNSWKCKSCFSSVDTSWLRYTISWIQCTTGPKPVREAMCREEPQLTQGTPNDNNPNRPVHGSVNCEPCEGIILDFQPSLAFRWLQSQLPSHCTCMRDSKWEVLSWG